MYNKCGVQLYKIPTENVQSVYLVILRTYDRVIDKNRLDLCRFPFKKQIAFPKIECVIKLYNIVHIIYTVLVKTILNRALHV